MDLGNERRVELKPNDRDTAATSDNKDIQRPRHGRPSMYKSSTST
jgi:hypothetical protein